MCCNKSVPAFQRICQFTRRITALCGDIGRESCSMVWDYCAPERNAVSSSKVKTCPACSASYGNDVGFCPRDGSALRSSAGLDVVMLSVALWAPS